MYIVNFKRTICIILSSLLLTNCPYANAIPKKENLSNKNSHSTTKKTPAPTRSILNKLCISSLCFLAVASFYGITQLKNTKNQVQNNKHNGNPPQIPTPISKTKLLPLPVNKNIRNTNNLCFYDSFIQQLYSSVSFRKFLNDTNPDDLTPELRNQLELFKDLFTKMGTYTEEDAYIEPPDFLNFATQTLGKIEEIGEMYNFDDILSKCTLIQYFMKHCSVDIPHIFGKSFDPFMINIAPLKDEQEKPVDISPTNGQFTFIIVGDVNDRYPLIGLQNPIPPTVHFKENDYIPTAITVFDRFHYVTYKMSNEDCCSWYSYDGYSKTGVDSCRWWDPFSPRPGQDFDTFANYIETHCCMITFTDKKLLSFTKGKNR